MSSSTRGAGRGARLRLHALDPDLRRALAHAHELVSRCRSLNRTIAQLDQELEQRTAEIAPALLELPGCAAVTAAKLLGEIGPIDRFKTDAQLARHCVHTRTPTVR